MPHLLQTLMTLITPVMLSPPGSDAFLLYVRRQVQEFSTGVSADMTQNEHFFTIPDLDFSDDPTDPRTRNQQSFAHTISFNGQSDAPSRAQRPAVHVYH